MKVFVAFLSVVRGLSMYIGSPRIYRLFMQEPFRWLLWEDQDSTRVQGIGSKGRQDKTFKTDAPQRSRNRSA